MTIKYRSAAKDKRNERSAFFAAIILLCVLFVTSCSKQEDTSIDILFEGGSGKAYVESPVKVEKRAGKLYATLVFSSSNYDYVLVNGEKYDNENPGGSSTFTVPVESLDEPFIFKGDTLAMSKPHEIEYKITWLKENDGASASKAPDAASERSFGRKPQDLKEVGIKGLDKTGSMELTYAKGFEVTEYGDYRLIRIFGAGDYLLIPEGGEIPDGLPDDIRIITRPIDKTYLVSTSVMDLVRQINALDAIRLSGLKEEDWHIKEAADLMASGKILYAGKYRAPDYELILSEGCDLAVENTMIYHDPEVKEKLEELGIPVIVETSSYEEDPLSRLEWIKLYGVLFDKEAEAESFFKDEEEKIRSAEAPVSTGKKVAFFSVSATGLIIVREPGDYIAKMIEMSGGDYIPDKGHGGTERGGTYNMQLEDFYTDALDADILIYNSTIDGELFSIDDLIKKNALFADLKAVKEGNVFCLKQEFFQTTTGTPDFLIDMKKMLEGRDDDYRFIYRLEG